jgi:YidC/Oxa1 family membrane protein insertase
MRMRQAETQAVYDKYGASPVGGCLPALIQIPILFALYRVIYNVPAYVEPVKEVYAQIANPIMNASGASDIMTELISSLGIRVSNFDITNIDKVIDTLYLVKSNAWETVSAAFSASPDVVSAISTYSSKIVSMNWLPGGMSVVDPPLVLSQGIAGAFPGVIIPILAALTQWLNMKVTQRNQPQLDTSTQMGSTMSTMNTMMPIMSLFFTTTLPAGMGVYWISSALIRTVITLIVDKVIGKTSVEEIIEQNKEKAQKKAEKRSEQQEKLEAYASMNTRKISDIAKVNRTEQESAADRKEYSKKSQTASSSADNSGKKAKSGDGSGQSIADIANMLKRRSD